MAKSHKDSVNVPIILKQSSLLKAVPVSQVHPNPQVTIREEQPSTAPFTTASTTTTVEVASEAPARSPNPRLRGQRIRNNFGRTTTTVANEAAPEQHAEDKPQHSLRRPNLRDGPRYNFSYDQLYYSNVKNIRGTFIACKKCTAFKKLSRFHILSNIA